MNKKYYTIHEEIRGLDMPAHRFANIPREDGGEKKTSEIGGAFRGGLQVSAHVKDEMLKNPNADFLYFSPIEGQPDQYRLQFKYPEQGKDDKGVTFNIRKNMNYFHKAIAGTFFDLNEVCSPEAAYDSINNLINVLINSEQYSSKEKQETLYNFIVRYAKPAEEDKEDLKNFCFSDNILKTANSNFKEMISGTYVTAAKQNVDKLVKAQKEIQLLEEKQEQNPLTKEDQEDLSYYREFKDQIISNLHQMKDMDVNAQMSMVALGDTMGLRNMMAVNVTLVNNLHPDTPVTGFDIKTNGTSTRANAYTQMDEMLKQNSDYWIEKLKAEGLLENSFQYDREAHIKIQNQTNEAEKIHNEAQKLLNALQKPENDAIAKINAQIGAEQSKGNKANKEVLDGYKSVRKVIEQKKADDRKNNPEIKAAYEAEQDASTRYTAFSTQRNQFSSALMSLRIKLYQHYCKGTLTLSDDNPKEKEMKDFLEGLHKRKIYLDKSGQEGNPNRPMDEIRLKAAVNNIETFHMKMTIDNQEVLLGAELFFDGEPSMSGTVGESVGIGIFKDKKDYQKYCSSGDYFKEVTNRMLLRSTPAALDMNYAKPMYSTSVRPDQLAKMSGEEVISLITGVPMDGTPERLDKYIDALDNVYINTVSATEYWNIKKGNVEYNTSKEEFLSSFGNVIKESVLEAVNAQTKDPFNITVRTKNGRNEPLHIKPVPEVKAPEKEVKKPSGLWKFFHSKSAYNARMKDFRNYQKQVRAHNSSKEANSRISDYNQVTFAQAMMVTSSNRGKRKAVNLDYLNHDKPSIQKPAVPSRSVQKENSKNKSINASKK